MNEKDVHPQEERDVSSAQESVSQSEKVGFIEAYLRYRNAWPRIHIQGARRETREAVESEINITLEGDNNFCCDLDHYLSNAYDMLIPLRSYRTDIEGNIFRPSGSQCDHWSNSSRGEPTKLEIAPGMVVESFMIDWVKKLPRKFSVGYEGQENWAGARRQVPLIPVFGVQRWPEMEKFLENSRCQCSFKYEMLTGYSPVNKCRVELRNGNTYPVRD